jgi:hypothetical protein
VIQWVSSGAPNVVSSRLDEATFVYAFVLQGLADAGGSFAAGVALIWLASKLCSVVLRVAGWSLALSGMAGLGVVLLVSHFPYAGWASAIAQSVMMMSGWVTGIAAAVAVWRLVMSAALILWSTTGPIDRVVDRLVTAWRSRGD